MKSSGEVLLPDLSIDFQIKVSIYLNMGNLATVLSLGEKLLMFLRRLCLVAQKAEHLVNIPLILLLPVLHIAVILISFSCFTHTFFLLSSFPLEYIRVTYRTLRKVMFFLWIVLFEEEVSKCLLDTVEVNGLLIIL